MFQFTKWLKELFLTSFDTPDKTIYLKWLKNFFIKLATSNI